MPKKRLEAAAAVLELAADEPMNAIYLRGNGSDTMKNNRGAEVLNDSL
jgi:hypothetical protein